MAKKYRVIDLYNSLHDFRHVFVEDGKHRVVNLNAPLKIKTQTDALGKSVEKYIPQATQSDLKKLYDSGHKFVEEYEEVAEETKKAN